MKALVRYANATGGVGGRKLAPPQPVVISTSDLLSPSTMESYCIKATEDDHATAYFDVSFFNTDQELSCFAQHAITFVGEVDYQNERFFETNRPFIATSRESVEKQMALQVEGGLATNYFRGQTVGVLLDDSPDVNEAYARSLAPRLAAAGIKVKDVYRVNTTDASAMESQSQGAALRFHADHVTAVLWDANLLAAINFTNSAQSQGYHPRYFWNDYNNLVQETPTYINPVQLAGSLAVTTGDHNILEQNQSPSSSSSANRKQQTPGVRNCLDVLSKYNGINYYQNTSQLSTSALFYCDHFFLWLDAARKVGAGVTPQTWGAGLQALGGSYASAETHLDEFGSGLMDGAAAYRVGAYTDQKSCNCFRAVGPWKPLSY